MPAILNSKHHQFCNWLQNIKAMHPIPDDNINELEGELENMYKNYRQKLDELKQVIDKYQEKQKEIKNEVKRIRKISLIS